MKFTDIENNQPLAVCLHASASSSRQWSKLVADFGGHMRVVTPGLIGYREDQRFRAGQRMRMHDEVENILAQIEAETGKNNGPLHLIGHSYGGAVALQISLMYPERVASLTLYEPAQFLLLLGDGLKSPEAQEILTVHRYVQGRAKSYLQRWAAAKYFIEYWSGRGTWMKISFRQRRRFVSLLPKVAAEFNAIFSAMISAEDCASLQMPIRIICGTRTRASASKVCDELSAAAPAVERVFVEGAAHMAPATQPKIVNPLIIEHVFACASAQMPVAA